MGKLIVVEGGDGAGKSTQIELIKNHLESNNLTYKFFHFPAYGDNEFSEVISKFLRGEFGPSDKVNPYFVANIFAMDQFLFMPKLEKFISKYDVVLLDRYIFSNVAYQGAKYDSNSKDAQTIMDWIFNFQFNFLKMPMPDLALYLDVPIEIIKERLIERAKNENRAYLNGKTDIHEADTELQNRVHDNYKLMCKKDVDFHEINCAKLSGDFGETHWFLHSPEDIFESYKQLILDLV